MQCIFISLTGTSLSADEINFLSSKIAKQWIVGIVLFRENIYPDPMKLLCDQLSLDHTTTESFKTDLVSYLQLPRLTPTLLRKLTKEDITSLLPTIEATTVMTALNACKQQFDSTALHTQLQTLIATILSINPNLLIAIDEEGGHVQRTQEIETLQRLPSAKYLGSTYEESPEKGNYELINSARNCAENLRGIADIVFAPCIDIDDKICPIISKKDRAFSANTSTIQACAEIILNTFNTHGIMACTKHWPGHGRTEHDTHKISHVVDQRPGNTILKEAELYRSLPSEFIMTCHVSYPRFTKDENLLPASYRKDMIDLLKNVFDPKTRPLICTDCLNMGTLSIFDQESSDTPSIEDLATRIERSLAAGHDLAMLTHQPTSIIHSILLKLSNKKIKTIHSELIQKTINQALENRKTYWNKVPKPKPESAQVTKAADLSIQPNPATLSVNS
jgi:beta-N-acetylhexosaminidase